MDKIGLVDSITEAVGNIAAGRIGLATDGEEHAGRLAYVMGLSGASLVFDEVQQMSDVELLLLAEHTFLQRELHSCAQTDTDALNSLTQAVESFDDAFRALEVVRNSAAYHEAEKTYPRNSKHRVLNYPKDAFHCACSAHQTRLRNTLRAPGLNLTEKSVYRQRRRNLGTMRSVYLMLQETALGQT
jgi:hypothetical protein